jgi:hypothetical protein
MVIGFLIAIQTIDRPIAQEGIPMRVLLGSQIKVGLGAILPNRPQSNVTWLFWL